MTDSFLPTDTCGLNSFSPLAVAKSSLQIRADPEKEKEAKCFACSSLDDLQVKDPNPIICIGR